MANAPIPRSVWTNPIHFLAFGFGAGTIPFAPGTFGTLIAIPLYLLVRDFSLLTYGIILLAVIIAGIWICDVAERTTGVRDHSGIVWDEIAGFLLMMFAAPHSIIAIALGFVLFRIFDIWKPWPIRWLDQHVSGGLGIMVDDLLAAIYAAIILQILVRTLLHPWI
jgi:phosphatidylglycerophosphatase A